jgi:hypothetical protein
MIHGCVTLDEVFSAATARAASLVPETSGYLALAVGDATSRLPFAIDDRNVMLTTEGNVGITKRGEVLPPRIAAGGMRDVLSRLLSVSMGTAMPALAHAARPREESDRGVDAVIEEIEAALIPVNRAAARRALARLARETIKAKEQGKVRPRASTRPPPAPLHAEAAKAAPEPPKVVEAPRPALVEVRPVVTEAAAPMVAAHAQTPPPLAARERTPEPAVIEAREATPPPRLEMFPPREPTPPPVEAEPTPTVLGMVEVEEAGPAPEAHLEAAPFDDEPAALPTPSEDMLTTALPVRRADEPAEAAEPALAEAPAEEAVTTVRAEATMEPLVLAQPSESPELAFAMDARPRAVAEPLTPPFALETEAAPRVMPATRPMIAEPAHALTVTATPRTVAAANTRADDLLAHFGASCVSDGGVHEAAACLRRMTGVEPTPPPAKVELRVTRAEPYEELEPLIPADAETPLTPRVRARAARSGPSYAVTLAVLAVGLAGGTTLVRLRPDLFGMATLQQVAPPAAAPRKAPAPAAEAPAPTVEPQSPQGAVAPSWAPAAGTRAERGASERQR